MTNIIPKEQIHRATEIEIRDSIDGTQYPIEEINTKIVNALRDPAQNIINVNDYHRFTNLVSRLFLYHDLAGRLDNAGVQNKIFYIRQQAKNKVLNFQVRIELDTVKGRYIAGYLPLLEA